MKKLVISDTLSLPVDAVTRRIGFVGTIGSGKTFCSLKIVEEMLGIGAQVVILDPVGVHWGLRLAADGKKPGISIPVFGGLHGDVPLESTGGALVADLIIDRGISVVIDVSQFEYDTDKARFSADFARRFYFRKKASPSAVFLLFEEFQEFCPQNAQRGEEKMVHEIVRICKVGRNFGIGVGMTTQRPQEVNKKALNLVQCLFAFQTTGTHERKAIDAWMMDKGLDLDIANDLPKLPVGTPHVWSPGWLGISEKVKIGPRWTYNASETPKVGERNKVKELAKVDLQKISEAMKETIERAKAEDPKELNAKIKDLEKKNVSLEKELEIERKKKVPPPVPTFDPKALDRLNTEEQRKLHKLLEGYKKKMLKYHNDLLAKAQGMADEAQRVVTLVETVKTEGNNLVLEYKIDHKEETVAPASIVPPVPYATTVRTEVSPRPVSEGEVKLAAGARRMLAVLAQWYPNGMPEGQMRSHARLKKSGTYTNYKSALYTNGLMEQRSDGLFYATKAGIEYIGEERKNVPTSTKEVVDMWKPKLADGARRMLDVLVKHGGEFISEEDLRTEANLAKSGTYTNYKSALNTARLIVTEGGGRIAANRETLFL